MPELSFDELCLYAQHSMHPAIGVTDVWKSYGRTPAVRGLTLDVPAGSIYGFLGPNGAGKSTTIRVILGLQRPDRGAVLLFGHPRQSLPTSEMGRIGSVVESPALYPHLTGRENLEVHRLLLDVPAGNVSRVLEVVGLSSAADRLVRGYSSGMKQRLGLAEALLSDPELLVLDEPTNGLDPAGIHEIRSLLRELPSKCGVTVFLSSHLLAEVEQIATHLAIVSGGQAKFQGTVEQLRCCEPVLEIEADQVERAAELLTQAGLRVSLSEHRLQVHARFGSDAAQINRLLVTAQIGVSHLNLRQPGLEELFLKLTKSTADNIENVAAPCL